MSLKKYVEKRDFEKTPEPNVSVNSHSGLLKFVVQRHHASHLHYDFRLEMDGVLKSWAVPKGPSMDPTDKRLAMMVEDHPLEYAGFEGTIPEGNYGAGTVEIWDSGVYHAEGSTKRKESETLLLAGLKSGEIKFVLHGNRLNGSFVLVKMKGQGKNAWLLIKHRDKFAIDGYNSEDYVPESSKTHISDH